MATKKLTTEGFKEVLKKMIKEELDANYKESMDRVYRAKAMEFLENSIYQKVSERCGWVSEPRDVIYQSSTDSDWIEVFTQPNEEAPRLADFGTYFGALASALEGEYKIKKGRKGDLDSKSGICSFKFMKDKKNF